MKRLKQSEIAEWLKLVRKREESRLSRALKSLMLLSVGPIADPSGQRDVQLEKILFHRWSKKINSYPNRLAAFI
ncbi:hypothetical protein C0J52_22067 [Blattella germanica]|nr:hypothetical protein C0J52_22067 [Blattella germanica]